MAQIDHEQVRIYVCDNNDSFYLKENNLKLFAFMVNTAKMNYKLLVSN